MKALRPPTSNATALAMMRLVLTEEKEGDNLTTMLTSLFNFARFHPEILWSRFRPQICTQ